MTPYTPIRSSFEFIDFPMHYLHSNLSTNAFPTIKDVFLYAGSMVVTPIVLCAVPLTITADIVVGIAESAFCLIYRRDGLQAVGAVAKKKMIVSPLHQLTYVMITLGAGAVLISGICGSIMAKAKSGPSAQLVANQSFKFILSLTTLPFIWVHSNPAVESKKDANKIKNSALLRLIHNKMVFIAANVAAIALAYLLHKQFLSIEASPKASIIILASCVSVFALHSYRLSQRFIGSLSNSWNHRCFNIFKNGGTQDESGRIYTDQGFRGVSLEDWERVAEEDYQRYKPQYTYGYPHSEDPTGYGRTWNRGTRTEYGSQSSGYSYNHNTSTQPQNWKAFWEKLIGSNQIDRHFKHANALYNTFRDGILAGKSPSELLGLEANPTPQEIKKAYYQYSRVIHPNNNPDRNEESKILFQCLNEARSILDPMPKQAQEPSQTRNKNKPTPNSLVPVK